MNKKFLIFCASVFLGINIYGYAQEVGSSTSSGKFVLIPKENHAFEVGEKLIFNIKYEFITAGIATMEVATSPFVNGRPTIRLISKADSAGVVENFFKVRDFNSEIVDEAALVTYSFHQNLREGNFKIVRNTTYDYDQKMFFHERQYKGKVSTRSGPIKGPGADILASFFVTRTLPLEPGKEYFITAFSDADIYPLRVLVYPKTEIVNVPAGRFECIKIQPFIVGDGIFKAKDGQMQIWLTNDQYKMPVLIRSKVFIGAVDAELQSFVRPGKSEESISE